MNRVVLISLLVSVLGSQGKSVLDPSNGSRTFTDTTLESSNRPPANVSDDQSFVKGSSPESTSVSKQEDQDSIESSETIVYNRFEKPSDDDHESAEAEEESRGPPDHVIPYSEHEEPRDVPTKPKYVAPGEWAKPPKDKDVPLDFVPTKVLAQVRKTHTLRRLPRKKAIENAESDEEKENASRLREVVKNTKVNTVYTEEGYEDSAYDHAGHVRDADFEEEYARKLHDHLNLKKNSGDDDLTDNEGEENETEDRKYKKIHPEEYRDIDEDYNDRYETRTEHKIDGNVDRVDDKWKNEVNPKLVVETGVEKLQQDLEKEAEEMEKGIEISKLEKVRATTDREISAESMKREDYNKNNEPRKRKVRKRIRPSSLTKNKNMNSREEIEESSRNIENSSAVPLDEERISSNHGVETTTLKEKLEYNHGNDGNTLIHDPTDYERVEENPTTVSYSQLFWDYFKTRENQSTSTEIPSILESTTSNTNLLQASFFVGNVNNVVPYSAYDEPTTPLPIIESPILTPQKIIPGQILSNLEYSKNNSQNNQLLSLDGVHVNEYWQQFNSNDPPIRESIPVSEIYNDKISFNDQAILFSNPQENLDSDEEFNTNFDSSLFNPTLNSLINRKPRYKITIRHKPMKSEESSDPEFSTQKLPTLNPTTEPLIETTTPEAIPVNENYMKVLMHLKNEKNTENFRHPNGLQQNNFHSPINKKNLEDLTRLRPPRPQKTPDYYYNFAPRSHQEFDAAQSDWSSLPVPQRLHQVYPIPRTFLSDSPHTIQRLPFNRKRNSMPMFDSIRPAPLLRNDLIWHKEPIDYVNRAGNRSKQGRNVLRPFRQTIGLDGVRGIRAKRRERRFVRGRDDDESGGVVKGSRSIANNGTSNRGEIERSAKNPSIERNCSQKVTRVIEVGLVPDTSRAKQYAEKKSRSCANDRGVGSRVAERESSVDGVNENEGRNGDIDGDLGAVKYDDGKKGEGNVVSSVRNKRNVGGENSKAENKSVIREELLEEGLKVAEDVDSTRKNTNVLDEDSKPKSELKEHEELLDGASKMAEAVDSMNKEKNIQEENSEAKVGLKEHEKLLNEAPEVAEDVIEKEINDRFNEDEEEDEKEEQEDRKGKAEVEVPEFDYVEELIEEDPADNVVTTEASFDLEKYPFYDNEKLPTPSALKYAMNPRKLPRKTYGAMEFYNSRDAYKQCDEVEPNLEVLPEKEEPISDRGPKENTPRLRGLGDKLDCFKAKYFDNNPFDNPLFFEKQVEDPAPPLEMGSKQFASRIMMFPKENDNYVIQKSSRRPESYRQPRKHNSLPVRLQNRRRIRYKTYQPRTRTRSRTRTRTVPQGYRIQSSQVKHPKTSKRPRKTEKRPNTAASEISSLYTPYQSQVYEDVMGTIKNLANSYQVYEVTTIPASEEVTVADDIDDDVKTNSSTNSSTNTSTNSTSHGKKGKGSSVMIDIVDHSSNVDINVKGRMPPQRRNRYRGVYKRNKVPQKTRPRIQRVPKPVVGLRTVKRRRKVRVYKRDLSDSFNTSHEDRLLVGSIELDSREKKVDDAETFFDSEESNYGRTNSVNSTSRTDSTIKENKNVPVQKNSTNSRAVTKAIDSRRKSKVPKSVTVDVSNSNRDKKKEKSQKVVYTIKDRIKYSKPKGEVRRVGKFVNEPKVEIDSRRREPKYNYIRRKGSSNFVSSTTENSLSTSTGKPNWTETATTMETVTQLRSQEITKNDEEAQYVIGETKNANVNTSEGLDHSKRDSIERPNEQTENKTESGYAVYENVNEGEMTTTQKPPAGSSLDFFNLKTFLETNPPGYTELSSEDFKKSFFLDNNNNTDDLKMNVDSTSSNRTQNESKKDEDTSKTFHPSYLTDEQSSEETETNPKVQSSTESSEESSAPSKESESVEDRTFFTYTSRPFSPAENYEDEKYSDLGPRVNKPAFLHPPFSFSNNKESRPKGSSEETEESDEEKEEYVFPWYRDKEDQRKRKRTRYRNKSTGEYEYPWERRERLAREEKRRKEEKRKRLVKSFEDDEDDAEEAFSMKRRRNIYPRGRYRFWSNKDRDASEDSSSDNAKSSSEYQPVIKYSSRYNSKNIKLPLDEKSRSVKSSSVEEISRSIKKALEGDSEEKVTSEEKENDSSREKKPTVSHKTRGISRGIIPEDVTLAPTRKTGRKEKTKFSDSADASIEAKNSSELAKNTLDNSESQITVFKTGPRKVGNSTNELHSTRQSNKKRRRPLKNAPAVETTTKSINEANRTRRRQKPISTTPATIASTSKVSATSTSRSVRRRNQKSTNDLKRNDASKIRNKSVDDVSNETETSTRKTGTVEHRSRGKKKSRANEIVNELIKNVEDQELSAKDSMKKKHLEKINDDRAKNPVNGTAEKKLINDDAKKIEEAGESKQIFPSVGSDERFDFKDDEIETFSDFDKPGSTDDDDEDEFGSVLKTDANFTPQNRALQLSEQGSREIVSSVSWISENYDF